MLTITQLNMFHVKHKRAVDMFHVKHYPARAAKLI
jgi:hypothetical protein